MHIYHMDLGKNSAHEKKENSSILTSCEGDGPLLNFLKDPTFGSSSFVIHTTYYGKVANY